MCALNCPTPHLCTPAGTIAVKFKSSQKTFGVASKLTIRGVFKAFKEIATTSGEGERGGIATTSGEGGGDCDHQR